MTSQMPVVPFAGFEHSSFLELKRNELIHSCPNGLSSKIYLVNLAAPMVDSGSADVLPMPCCAIPSTAGAACETLLLKQLRRQFASGKLKGDASNRETLAYHCRKVLCILTTESLQFKQTQAALMWPQDASTTSKIRRFKLHRPLLMQGSNWSGFSWLSATHSKIIGRAGPHVLTWRIYTCPTVSSPHGSK